MNDLCFGLRDQQLHVREGDFRKNIETVVRILFRQPDDIFDVYGVLPRRIAKRIHPRNAFCQYRTREQIFIGCQRDALVQNMVLKLP